MNLKEAYSILEIPQNTSPEDAKKKYRELAKKYHPDVNKEPDAEAKLKKINEAYQVVSSGKSTDREEVRNTGWGGLDDIFNPFGGRQQVIYAENIVLQTTLSFKEAVLGCKRNLTYKRRAKCRDCNGQGETPINNGCEKCGGRGQVVTRQGNTIMMRTCDKCGGRTSVNVCNTCEGEGVVDAEADITVNVPGGRNNGDVLRLSGMGNYVSSFGPMDQHTDAHLYITVTPEPGLSLDGNDVVCTLRLSLLDALQGYQCKVNTINGEQEIKVPALSKNKEEVVLPRLGVNGAGRQRVILDIDYPKDISKVIETLKNEEK